MNSAKPFYPFVSANHPSCPGEQPTPVSRPACRAACESGPENLPVWTVPPSAVTPAEREYGVGSQLFSNKGTVNMVQDKPRRYSHTWWWTKFCNQAVVTDGQPLCMIWQGWPPSQPLCCFPAGFRVLLQKCRNPSSPRLQEDSTL